MGLILIGCNLDFLCFFTLKNDIAEIDSSASELVFRNFFEFEVFVELPRRLFCLLDDLRIGVDALKQVGVNVWNWGFIPVSKPVDDSLVEVLDCRIKGALRLSKLCFIEIKSINELVHNIFLLLCAGNKGSKLIISDLFRGGKSVHIETLCFLICVRVQYNQLRFSASHVKLGYHDLLGLNHSMN